MAKGKKADEGIEILEDPNAILDKTNEFFENKKNRAIVFGLVGVVILAVLGIGGYQYFLGNQERTAQEELFQAQYYFEADSLGLALNGDGNSYGFLDIIDEFGGTKAANLSSFYAGACYLKLGDYDGAIRLLNDFSSSDYLLQARAYSLIGDANMEQANYSEAASYYERAANYKPNDYITPVYIKKLAVAQENAGAKSDAIDAYSEIITKYPTSSQIHDARKNKARLEALN